MINVLKKMGIGFFFILCFGQGICVRASGPVFEKEGGAYLIQSAEDMRTLALLVNGGKEVEPGVAAHNASYRLTRDIDLSPYCTGEEGWEPIGCGCGEEEDETCVREFNGTFDGGNHVVTGLSINRPNADDQGLFGKRSNVQDGKSAAATVIKNLYIKDCDIIGFQHVGGVIGGGSLILLWNDCDDIYIDNCHVTGRIMGEHVVGGIAGVASSVKNSDFSGTVISSGTVGGIACYADYVYSCAAHADIEGKSVGGIAERAVCVQNSYVTGSVKGYESVGGIAGRSAKLTGCYTLADVSGYILTGGMVGKLKRLTMSKDSGGLAIQKCLMGGYRMESPGWENPEYNYEFNGYIYGSAVGFDDEAPDPDFYYRKGLKLDGFIEGRNFSTRNCKSIDCTHLEKTDFQELLGRPEEEWSDVWYCAADYVWPILAWEKDSRFGYTVTVTVQEGDSLWEIADAVYGDGHFWTQIYEENKERIGGDANLILPGTDLEIAVNASQADYAAKGDIGEQEKTFLEVGRERGITRSELKGAYRRLLADDLWNSAVWEEQEEQEKQINDWAIDDLDGNGQTDMVVMAGLGRGMVPGEIRLYWNDEPAYILKDETAYYEEDFAFGFGFWEIPRMGDFDNDGNLELVMEVYNGGNGGPGGRNTCLFRHVGDKWVECLEELPNDYGEPGEAKAGLRVHVACIGVDRYEAYCPYLDERIEFDGKNNREIGEDEYGRAVGSNVWGFYHLECVKYEGKNALECREYLSGEGGNAHGVGVAVFILTWDADGVCRVADWRIEGWN